MSPIDAMYIALDDPHNVHSWSGTTYFMGRAFEAAGFRLSYIGPLKIPSPLLYRIKGKILRLRGWDYGTLGETRVLKSLAQQATSQLHGTKAKVILSCGRPHLAYLETSLPFLFFDDGSIPAMAKLFPGAMNMHPKNKRNFLEAERRTLEKCHYACYMSHWAAEAALETYGAQFESKIKVIPIGANLERPPTAAEVENAIQSRSREGCELLFVGVDWKRKGGAIAVAIAQELRNRGVAVRLHIVGCTPPVPVPDFVQVHGFISKDTEAGRELLERLYRESHFFLLPTQAEPYGIAFVEANAYGLPVLGCNVGGVPTIVRDGENGRLFPPTAPPQLYADCIENRLRVREDYEALCRSAYGAFATRLNWGRFGETVRELVAPLVE